jgi:hypothetical protein
MKPNRRQIDLVVAAVAEALGDAPEAAVVAAVAAGVAAVVDGVAAVGAMIIKAMPANLASHAGKIGNKLEPTCIR